MLLELTHMEDWMDFDGLWWLQFISCCPNLLHGFEWTIVLGCQFEILMNIEDIVSEGLKLEIYHLTNFKLPF
jgi:hypothetical protein